MLEAVFHGPRFTISLKRSTQNSSAIHKLPADYPILGPTADLVTEGASRPSSKMMPTTKTQLGQMLIMQGVGSRRIAGRSRRDG